MKFASRKFIVASVTYFSILILPVVYKLIGISDDILMVTLTTSSAVSGLYLGMNVAEKKING